MTGPQHNKATDAAHYASGDPKPPLRARFFARASSVDLAKQSQLEARTVLAEQSQASIGTPRVECSPKMRHRNKENSV